MNKRTVIAELNKIANELDNSGKFNEANQITNVMMRVSQFEVPYISGLAAQYGADLVAEGKYPFNPSGGPSFPKNPYAKDSIYPDAKTKPRDISIPYNPSGGIMYPPKDINTQRPPRTVQTTPIEAQPDPAPLGPRTGEGGTRPDKPTKPGEVGKKPSGPTSPSKPTTPNDAPRSVEGLDRWVNKAENIYSQWVLKGANPGSTAHLLIKDIVDYMEKVKGNLPSGMQTAADAKISKVQLMMQSVFDGIPMPKYALPYSLTTGYPGKGANPFEQGKRITDNKLDYQAKQEGKSY